MIVSLRITTNVATSSTPMTVRSRALIAAGAALASLGCRSVLLVTIVLFVSGRKPSV